MGSEEYITDEAVVKRALAAVELELKKKEAMDIPVSVYDPESGIIYDETSDGKRTPVAKRMRKGRYSERILQKA